MAIKTYKRGSAEKLAPNFRAREFDCQGKGCCTETPIDEKLVAFLQQIRDHFGKPVELTAYRCPTHNAKVANAAPNSRHTKGQAADFHIDGVAPAEIAKYAESIGVKGIGLYDTDKDGHFVHIDTRTTKSFWYGHAQAYRNTFGGAQQESKGENTVNIELTTLSKGANGEQVKTVQRLLIALKYDLGSLGADGDFGGKTDEAVRKFQTKKKLESDGIVGKDTWTALLKG